LNHQVGYLLFMQRRPPGLALFPYTTLFRSSPRARRSAREKASSTTILRSTTKKIRLGAVRSSTGRSAWHASAKTAISMHAVFPRSEEHTSELQSRENLVCRLLLEKKKNRTH